MIINLPAGTPDHIKDQCLQAGAKWAKCLCNEGSLKVEGVLSSLITAANSIDKMLTKVILHPNALH